MARATLASAEAYTVALVTALPKERTALLIVCDERHQPPESFEQAEGDDNSYSWGKIGKHNVVIASLPAGSYGLVSAANVVTCLRASLPHTRIGLLVGIGAGLGNVELGDLVVSQPDGTSGGVVQYDLVKRKSSDEEVAERIGQLDRPPTVLLNALANLQAEHGTGERQLESILAAFDKNADTQKYKRPVSGSTTIHYGIIASGNSLVKSTQAREKIVDDLAPLKPKCIEMEAAGVMNSFPCLVIRGICDYANELKNDDWQMYASGVAAAFAKELLQFVRVAKVEELETIGKRSGTTIPSTTITNSGSGSVNTNFGGTQNNFHQSGNNNRQFNGTVNYR